MKLSKPFRRNASIVWAETRTYGILLIISMVLIGMVIDETSILYRGLHWAIKLAWSTVS